MNLVTMVVLVIVVTIFATITLAGISYGVFKLRESRTPRLCGPEDAGPKFFERVLFATSELDPVQLDPISEGITTATPPWS